MIALTATGGSRRRTLKHHKKAGFEGFAGMDFPFGVEGLYMKKLLLGMIAIAAGAALGAGIVSCGDQSSSTTDTTTPELTPPVDVETAEQSPQPDKSTGTTVTGEAETTTNETTEEKTTAVDRTSESKKSDKPPPEDSAAERFENYCDENPGACD